MLSWLTILEETCRFDLPAKGGPISWAFDFPNRSRFPTLTCDKLALILGTMTRTEEVKSMIRSFVVSQKGKGLDARFFLFGSRVRGDNRARSDFDLAIDAGRPLPATIMADLRDGLEELPTLFRIDLVDAAAVSDRFAAEAFSAVEELA